MLMQHNVISFYLCCMQENGCLERLLVNSNQRKVEQDFVGFICMNVKRVRVHKVVRFFQTVPSFHLKAIVHWKPKWVETLQYQPRGPNSLYVFYLGSWPFKLQPLTVLTFLDPIKPSCSHLTHLNCEYNFRSYALRRDLSTDTLLTISTFSKQYF